MKKEDIEIKGLFQIYGRKASIETVLAATRELRKHVSVEKSISLSAQAQELKELCISFGPSGPKLAKICSILLRENIMVKDTGKLLPFVLLSCVIPGMAVENYKAGIPLFCLIEEKKNTTVRFITADGFVGNFVPLAEGTFEVASDDLVVSTINKIFDKIVKDGGSDEGIELIVENIIKQRSQEKKGGGEIDF